MQTITIIIGLPGSGKSTYIKNNSDKFKNAVICDDYHKSSYDHSHEFKDSVYYQDLQKALKNSKDVVLTDIIWCKAERLKILEKEINAIINKLKLIVNIKFVYFENNPNACKINILKRNRTETVEKELKLVNELSKGYTIPHNASIISIIN